MLVNDVVPYYLHHGYYVTCNQKHMICQFQRQTPTFEITVARKPSSICETLPPVVPNVSLTHQNSLILSIAR